MNQQHAREARIVNRAVGALAKRDRGAEVEYIEAVVAMRAHALKVEMAKKAGEEPPADAPTIPARPRPHKLPRSIKRMWASKSHRARGAMSTNWRDVAGQVLTARINELRQDPDDKSGLELRADRKARRAAARDVVDVRQGFRELSRSSRRKVERHFRASENPGGTQPPDRHEAIDIVGRILPR